MPKIGGILALRSENMTNKVNYDIFCEKLGVYIMNEFKGGENVVEVTKTMMSTLFRLLRRITSLSNYRKPKRSLL